ncbi:MAG: hypothetical protein QNJ98_09750 [Planctomycetota bacterium]|nr:hypothetical protein [Planctomycetota bacterium]
MTARKSTALVFIFSLVAAAFLLHPGEAQGDAKSELADVVKKGKALWTKQWKKGAKTCATCHDRGPNKLTAKRLNAWPKYDRFLKKVATGQEKIAQMIKKMSMGPEVQLGADDLTALEAYIKTR